MTAPGIMVVEDERITALSLCRTLSRLGYDVTAAHASGEAALQHITETPPDLILMDIHLEGDLDGIETAARIPPNLMLPVVYLSAFADDSTLQRARATRPYGYVIKPATERELNAAIQMALERRATDFALKENEQRLRLALETAELGMWELDAETEHILYKDHAGWSSEARPRLLAERFREFLATVEHEDRSKVMEAFDRVSNSSEACEIEFRRTSSEHGHRWYRVVGKAVRLPNDRRRRIVGVSRDVTSAKLAAAERWESEQNYRDLISNINGILWEVDRERNELTYVSDSVQRMLGYSAAEWMADPLFWEKHIHPDDLAQAMARYHTAPDSGRSYESTYRMTAKNGQLVWIHEAVSAVTGTSKKSILRGVMVDITNLKKAETELAATALRLAESEKRLAGILDTAAIGIVTVDTDLRIISFNLEAEQIFGYRASDMIGQPLDRLIPDKHVGAHRRDMKDFQGSEARAQSMGDWRQVRGKAADGREIPLAANISKVTVGGKSWLTVVMRDMTQVQRNEEELQQLLEERERAMARAVEANQAKSSFLAVMSHELRTPLNAIIGFSDLMRAEIGGPLGNPAYKEYVDDIHQAGALLLGIINSILDLSRIESGKLELKMERVCLKDAWARIESTVQSHAIAKGIELKFLQSDDTNWFRADVAAVSQILVNLIANAIKFTPNGGTVEVGEEAACRSGHLSFFVRDNGRGIPANKVKDVQKPFVQVSDSYVRDVGGVGLGLAICKSLAGAMSGRLRISSKLGKGTKVQVTFQRFDAAHEAPQAEAPARPARNA